MNAHTFTLRLGILLEEAIACGVSLDDIHDILAIAARVIDDRSSNGQECANEQYDKVA